MFVISNGYRARLLYLIASIFLSSFTSCGPDKKSESESSEAWDLRNKPSRVGLRIKRYADLKRLQGSQGVLPDRPWMDDYWPYQQRNMARRYVLNEKYESFEGQIRDAQQRPGADDLSPAEKYDQLVANDFSLTKQSWDRYEYYKARYEGQDEKEWSWQGICSGWAPASIAEDPPIHPVIARSAGKPDITFYEGDLRGLLSKVYDTNSFTDSRRNIGVRCDVKIEDIPRDRYNRPIDGVFKDSGKTFDIVRDWSEKNGVVQVRNKDKSIEWLMTESTFSRMRGIHQVWVYNDHRKVAEDIRDGKRGRQATDWTKGEVEFFKVCRDLNAGTFHLALNQLLSFDAENPASFVVEMDRDHQVWNHPVWGFKSQIGEPIPVARDKLATRSFRAPGTAYVVNVKTSLLYIVEYANPRITYDTTTKYQVDWNNLHGANKPYRVRDFRYSLEFDTSGILLGGEWTEDKEIHSRYPDFIWQSRGTPTDTHKRGGASPIKYSIVKQLVECSKGSPNAKVQAPLPTGRKELPAVVCHL